MGAPWWSDSMGAASPRRRGSVNRGSSRCSGSMRGSVNRGSSGGYINSSTGVIIPGVVPVIVTTAAIVSVAVIIASMIVIVVTIVKVTTGPHQTKNEKD